MKNFKIVFKIIIFSIFFFSNSSFGADVAKICVVDFQRIFETSNPGKLAQSEINEHGKKMEADLKERGAAIDEIKKKLEREALVMSKEMRQEREREIRIKINDFKTLQKRYMTNFKMQEQRLVGRIQQDIFAIVEEIGKKEGYLLILERREGGVLYFPKTNDITDKLIQMYNAKFAQKAGKKDQSKQK